MHVFHCLFFLSIYLSLKEKGRAWQKGEVVSADQMKCVILMMSVTRLGTDLQLPSVFVTWRTSGVE